MDQKHTYPFQRALGKVLRDRQFTALELADEAGCSERHVRRVANGKVRASAEMAGLISRYLCRHAETRCSNASAAGGWRVQRSRSGDADGEVEADLCDLLGAATDVRRHWQGKGGEKMDEAIDRIIDEALDLRAERRAHLPTD
jgi:transcriptional regulator with XRE-family HTH domain